MELTPGFVSLLEELRGVFNVQSFPIFVELMTGWVLSHRHRFVTDLIISSGSVEKRHFSNYHRFFSQYAWSLDVLSKHLLLLLVRAHRRNRVGDRRHAGSETRPDGLRNRNASRPSDVEQGQDDHQLGTRLGCAVSGDPTSRVGSHEGLQFALLLSPLPQPPRVEKRKEEDAEAGSHATQASCQAAKATKSPE